MAPGEFTDIIKTIGGTKAPKPSEVKNAVAKNRANAAASSAGVSSPSTAAVNGSTTSNVLVPPPPPPPPRPPLPSDPSSKENTDPSTQATDLDNKNANHSPKANDDLQQKIQALQENIYSIQMQNQALKDEIERRRLSNQQGYYQQPQSAPSKKGVFEMLQNTPPALLALMSIAILVIGIAIPWLGIAMAGTIATVVVAGGGKMLFDGANDTINDIRPQQQPRYTTPQHPSPTPTRQHTTAQSQHALRVANSKNEPENGIVAKIS